MKKQLASEKIEKTIKSCITLKHIGVCRNMIKQYEILFDDIHPFWCMLQIQSKKMGLENSRPSQGRFE